MDTTQTAAAAATDLARLVSARRAWIADLIARHPAQAPNRQHYEAELAGARLGLMTKRVRTKGCCSTYEQGQAVLVFARVVDVAPGTVSVWAPGSTLANSTVVRAASVEVLS